jgi:hypothetical protein
MFRSLNRTKSLILLSSKRNIILNRELKTVKNLIKYNQKNFNSNELDEDSVEFIEIEREDNSKRNGKNHLKFETYKSNIYPDEFLKEFMSLEFDTLKTPVDKEIHEFLEGNIIFVIITRYN